MAEKHFACGAVTRAYQHSGHESSSVGGREKAKASKHWTEYVKAQCNLTYCTCLSPPIHLSPSPSPSDMTTMTRSCPPLPTHTESNMEKVGGRNTSPCTSFHPKSSWISSWGGEEGWCGTQRQSVGTAKQLASFKQAMPRQSSSTLPSSPPYRVLLVVLEQIPVQRPQQDHGHHGR